MAYEIPGFSFPLPAGEDFRTGKGQFRFVDVSNTGKAVTPAAGARAVGVRQTTPRADEATTIVTSGVSIVEAGGAITAGGTVGSDATGRAIAPAAGNAIVGRALETASGAGVQIAVLLQTAAASA
jgi:Uncharacterized conserved protein (DUF2190)